MINMNCALWYINCRGIKEASKSLSRDFKAVKIAIFFSLSLTLVPIETVGLVKPKEQIICAHECLLCTMYCIHDSTGTWKWSMFLIHNLYDNFCDRFKWTNRIFKWKSTLLLFRSIVFFGWIWVKCCRLWEMHMLVHIQHIVCSCKLAAIFHSFLFFSFFFCFVFRCWFSFSLSFSWMSTPQMYNFHWNAVAQAIHLNGNGCEKCLSDDIYILLLNTNYKLCTDHLKPDNSHRWELIRTMEWNSTKEMQKKKKNEENKNKITKM